MKRITSFIVVLFVALVFLSATFVSNGEAAQQKRSKQFSKYFVSTQWVAKHKKIVLIDTRSVVDYAAGHITGAINFPAGIPISSYWFTRKEGNPAVDLTFTVPTPTEFIKLVNSLGITPKTTVVTYGADNAADFGFAVRLAWTLQLYGHQKAYVMDGGFPKWQVEYAAQVTTVAKEPTANTKSYAITGYSDIVATKYDVLSVVNENPANTMIFDTLGVGHYDAGHILGATYLTWTDMFEDNDEGIKVLKSEADLVALFEGLGITKDKTIITYCAGGFTSGHVMQVLRALGYPSVRNYVNSWSEWVNQDPAIYLVGDL